MRRISYLIANLMAGFMDFGVGCLIATFVALLTGHEVVWWELVVAGAVFNVLPDYDIVPFILWRGITGKSFNFDHHQTWLHWPIVVLPAVTTIVWFAFGTYWGIVALLCVLAHYVHDAAMMNSGLSWLVRLRRTYPEGTYEQHNLLPDQWIAQNWLQPSQLSINEITIGTLTLGTSVGILTNLWGFFATLCICWFCTALFWWTNRSIKQSRA